MDINIFKKDYSKLGLSDNPFPYSGVPEEEPHIYVDREEAIKAVNNVLSTTISTGKSNHIIVTGAYGSGKSHTLKYVRSEIRRQFTTNSEKKVCIGYVSQPGETFLDIYREFVYDLGYDFIRKIAEQYIGLVANQLSEEKVIKEKVPLEKAWEMVNSGKILISDIVPHAIKRLNQKVKFIDFTRAFLNLTYDDNSIYSWEWLNGEGVDYIKRRSMGVSKSLDGKTAIRAFISLKKILIELGYSTVILLIDEFEYAETLSPIAKQKILNEIRHLIDSNPENLTMIITCAPEVWHSLLSEYHAFSERITNEVNLKPMTGDKVKLLLAEYLAGKRLDSGKDIVSFTDESIKKILELSQGNTRRILTISGRLLDIALETEKTIIDTKTIEGISNL